MFRTEQIMFSVSKERKTMRKKAASKKQKTKSRKATTAAAKTRKRSNSSDAMLDRQIAGSESGKQSGDFQGLHTPEGADSESVDELLEEGNAFEAGVVRGVERADDDEEREVRTREVPEDDVPDEYLDKD